MFFGNLNDLFFLNRFKQFVIALQVIKGSYYSSFVVTKFSHGNTNINNSILM